jgi:TolB-like protein
MSRLFAAFVLVSAASFAHAAAPAKVLLLPFDSVGPADKAWVAKAIQQNLVAELGRVNSVQAVTADQPAKDLDAALKVASGAAADFVVFGAFQAVDGDLRITGQVIDVAKKQTVAGLKATGPQRDLFGMEDTIAAQLKKALPAAVEVAGPEMLKQPVAPQPPADAPIPGLDQRDPLPINQRAKQLEDEIDRAIQRLRNAPAFGGPDYYPPQNYFYSGVYSPYYYGYPIYYTYGNHCYYPCYNKGGGASFSGNFRGNNVAGGFAVGGASGGFVTGIRPQTANYANFGRMSVQPTRR